MGAPDKNFTLLLKKEQGKSGKSIYSYEYGELRKWLVGERSKVGLTQREVAALLDSPYSLVAKIENGERRFDVVIEYCRFCYAIGSDPHKGIEMVVTLLNRLV